MTVTQILVLVIGGLALLLSAELVRSVARQRRHPSADLTPAFRQVGTFGKLQTFRSDTGPTPSSGSSGKGLLAVLMLATFLATGTAIKLAWDETHPDLRSAYGRAYERCVADRKISRWKVEEVERCIDSGRGYHG